MICLLKLVQSDNDKMIQILETFVAGKNPSLIGEDSVFYNDNFLVVLDGVTGKDGATYEGKTGGRFAADEILGAIKVFEVDITSRDAVDNISRKLRERTLEANNGILPHASPGSQMAIYSVHRRELWRVGDIHLRIGDNILPTPSPLTDEVALAFRSALLESMLLGETTESELLIKDPSWEAMLPLLSRQDVFANLSSDSLFAYGVINGSRVPDKFLEIYKIPGKTEIVLASDGYLSPRADLVFAENELIRVLTEDPLLIKLHRSFRAAPKGSSFDDRAWLRAIV